MSAMSHQRDILCNKCGRSAMETSESGIKGKRGRYSMEIIEFGIKDPAQAIVDFSIMSALPHLKYEDSIMSPMSHRKKSENVKFRSIRRKDFKMFGLDALCVLAINHFNMEHNTKYEFLKKIKYANKIRSGAGHTFYITFQARQNATTQTFQTVVYKQNQDTTNIYSCQLEANA